jgi:hypothetical protein
MVIILNFAAVAGGLTFIVGQITWTIDPNSFVAMTIEETQIQSTQITSSPMSATTLTSLTTAPTTPVISPTTPTTHHSLPRYKVKQINETYLLGAVD